MRSPVTSPRSSWSLVPFLLSAFALSMVSSFAAPTRIESGHPLQRLYQSQIPKQETAVLRFLEQHPEYDGRGVTIAIFDTGVDPGAPGMQSTSTGERKLVDLYDASGAGDVDISTVIERSPDGTLHGLTGRRLILPPGVLNASGQFHLGIKFGKELFNDDAWSRLMCYRNEQLQRFAQEKKADELRQSGPQSSRPSETLTQPWDQLERAAREKTFIPYLESLKTLDKGPIYDCVVWQSPDGSWQVILDTDEDGDLRDETMLRPFGIAGEWASFPDYVSMNFAVQVLEQGNLLSIVTPSGSHGTHVASIAAAHFPDHPALDGVAPGAKILSIRIGDVRTDGSSTYIGENLAVALAAQHKVDIMNASWGGQSFYQDASSWGVQLYELLVQKYGVTAFVSTGNDGPALSTMGSPGGEAHSVIGVGAYVSPQMGELLYSVVGETPASTFMFSARGPARNGDLGVDVLAPGAAITSLAMDSLQGSDLYNGTSMAAPSAAGAGAILISAAKQNGLHTSPARIRYALMNTALYLQDEDPFAQGAGLIQVDAAWEHLQRFQSIEALDLFYKVEVSDNTYATGPGFYLRSDRGQQQGKQEVRVTLQPEFPDALDNRNRYDLNLYLQSGSHADWLQSPEYLHLSNAGKTIRPEVDLMLLSQDGEETQVHFTSLDLSLAEVPEAGPLIRIPFTIAQGHSEAQGRWLPKRDFELTGSTSYRRLLTPPDRCNHLSLRLRRADDGEVEKLFVLHGLTLLANDTIEAMEIRKYVRLKPGEEAVVEIPAIPGDPMEVQVHQVWFNDRPTQLSLEGTWRSILPQSDTVLVHDDGRPDTLRIVSRFTTQVELEAKLEQALFSYQPESVTILPLDNRGTYPRGRKDASDQPSFVLHQEFSVTLPEPLEVQFELVQYATEFSAGGGIVQIYDERGFPVATDLAPTDEDQSTCLPKGKNTLIREYVSPDPAVLELLKPLPIVLRAKIRELKVEVFEGEEHFSKNKPCTPTLDLQANRFTSLLFKAEKSFDKAKLPKSPGYLLGSLKLLENGVRVDTVRLIMGMPTQVDEAISGVSAGKETDAVGTTTADSQDKASDPIESVEQLQAAIYETQLQFLHNTRNSSSSSIRKERNSMFKSLLKDSTDPRLWLEEIYALAIDDHLLHPWFIAPESGQKETAPTSDGKELERKLVRMIQNCHPEKVAEYLGAPPVVDLPDSRAGKADLELRKNFNTLSHYLSEADLIAADLYLVLGNLTQARTFLNESKRWRHEEEANARITRLESRLLLAENKPALALEAMQPLLTETPRNPTLLHWRAQAYASLGWDLHVPFEQLYDEVSENALKLR